METTLRMVEEQGTLLIYSLRNILLYFCYFLFLGQNLLTSLNTMLHFTLLVYSSDKL